jgi:hypothetical protein
MSDLMALKIAIDLMHLPSQVRLLRSEPLPDGVLMLLRIAAGDTETELNAVELTGRSRHVIRRAATFFIEQILFAPDADSYQVLGASAQASTAELRRNVALLMRWLHPDLDARGERSIFVGRVTTAWNNLKTPERRAAYDELRQKELAAGKARARRGRGKRLAGVWPLRSAFSRHGPWMNRAEKVGFFRRAVSMLLHRPS